VEPSILIISPVRNEAAHIERVVRAVAAQELPPARWILRDDHSDDDTKPRNPVLHGLPHFVDCRAGGGASVRYAASMKASVVHVPCVAL